MSLIACDIHCYRYGKRRATKTRFKLTFLLSTILPEAIENSRALCMGEIPSRHVLAKADSS